MIVSRVQGLAFLPKTECNVHEVEIASGLMLTKTTIEPVAFSVPRVKVSQLHHLVDTWEHCISIKALLCTWTQTTHNLPLCVSILGLQKEFFQDDVYPDTAVWWEPALTASAWLAGMNSKHRKISLKPKDMTPGMLDQRARICGHVTAVVIRRCVINNTSAYFVVSERGPQRGSSSEILAFRCLPGRED